VSLLNLQEVNDVKEAEMYVSESNSADVYISVEMLKTFQPLADLLIKFRQKNPRKKPNILF
jgi:hypothetical protein